MRQTVFFAFLAAFVAASAPAQPWPDPLAANGYAEEAWHIAVDWEESTATGQLVHGYHLRSLTDGSTADVYVDGSGRALDAAELKSLDIAPKHWDAPPITTSPEVVPGFPSAKRGEPRVSWLSASSRKPAEMVFAAPADNGDTKSDADTAAKGLTRYGSIMDLPAPLCVRNGAAAFGEWHDGSDGSRIWTATVRVLGALGLRLHFLPMVLPEGSEFAVFATDAPETAEPVTVTASGWGPSSFGDAVTLACSIPPGQTEETLSLSVDRIGWMYQLPFEKAATVGSCNIHVACQSDWLTVAMAVGRLAKAGSDGLWACTGALVADTVSDSQVPYFLTANHCVSSQAEAASIEVYWLYQASACDAAPPSILARRPQRDYTSRRSRGPPNQREAV